MSMPELWVNHGFSSVLMKTSLEKTYGDDSEPSPNFSVIICTYNGAKKLPGVLDALLHQQGAAALRWELVVVDNNSSDATAQIVRRYQRRWPGHIPFRYYFEGRQGLAYARRCAVRHGTAPLMGFLDDDNLPAENWVLEAWRFGQAHPAGAYGSAISPLYEASPPQGFSRIASLLAIVDRGDEPFTYTRRRGVLPAGAGMVIRRCAWLAHVPEAPRLAGVTSRSLRTKGEDVETLSYIRDSGWEVWHNPAMKLRHQIPAERLQRPYLLELSRSVGLNRFPLRMVRWRRWRRAVMIPLYLVSDFRKLALYWLSHRRSLRDDTVCLCEFTLLKSTAVSPFYHWMRQRRSPADQGLPSGHPVGR